MNDKSLFRTIAKQVHPDMSVNSDITSGARMREAIAFKDNPNMLIRLARQWGLNIDGSFDKNVFNEKSKAFKERVFNAVVGAIIKHTVNTKKKTITVRGVIVNKRYITRGHFKGAIEYKVYDFISGGIFISKSYNDQPFDMIMGMASSEQLNDGIERVKEIKDQRKARADIRQDIANDKFGLLGLVSNLSYKGNFKVLVNYRTGARWETLERTTAKCVFLTSGRRINIQSILEAKEKKWLNLMKNQKFN